MKSINKLLALLLALIFSLGSLASCEQLGIGGQLPVNPDGENGENSGNEENGGNSDIQIDPDRYVANVSIRFATNDDKMKTAVDAMASSAVINVDKENISVNTVSALNDTSIVNNYSLVGGVLYRGLLVSSGEYAASSYKKADVSDLSANKLLSDLGTGANIGISDFDIHDMSKSSGGYTYTCSDITDDARASLCGIVSSRFSSVNSATVTLEAVEYILETIGELNESSILSCHFTIVMNGVSYAITMRIYTEYDYTANPSISAPADADDYLQVDYSEVVG